MKETIQNKETLSYKLKKRAISEGFAVSGIASIPGSSRLGLRTKALERWLTKNYHSEMNLKDQKEIINKENKNKEEIVYSKKIIKPSKQELENHKEFMKKEFKRNFFN